MQGSKELLETPIVDAGSLQVNQVTCLRYASKGCIVAEFPANASSQVRLGLNLRSHLIGMYDPDFSHLYILIMGDAT